MYGDIELFANSTIICLQFIPSNPVQHGIRFVSQLLTASDMYVDILPDTLQFPSHSAPFSKHYLAVLPNSCHTLVDKRTTTPLM